MRGRPRRSRNDVIVVECGETQTEKRNVRNGSARNETLSVLIGVRTSGIFGSVARENRQVVKDMELNVTGRSYNCRTLCMDCEMLDDSASKKEMQTNVPETKNVMVNARRQ